MLLPGGFLHVDRRYILIDPALHKYLARSLVLLAVLSDLVPDLIALVPVVPLRKEQPTRLLNFSVKVD